MSVTNKRTCLITYTFISGGSHGSDYQWILAASRKGYVIRLQSFLGHSITVPKGIRIYKYNTEEYSVSARESAIHVLTLVARKLDRKLPQMNTYNFNLLLRNYFIAKEAAALYAIGYFLASGQIDGGTAWGVGCFLELYAESKPLYFFDINQSCWFTRFQGTWIKIDSPPAPIDNSAGIGTRMITGTALEALKTVFTA